MPGVSLLTYSPTVLRAGEDAPDEDMPVDDVGTLETFAAWWDHFGVQKRASYAKRQSFP